MILRGGVDERAPDSVDRIRREARPREPWRE
jgi:hypothetical protein